MQTKSQLLAENAALRARLAELDVRLANLHAVEGTHPESEIARRYRIEHEIRFRLVIALIDCGVAPAT